MEETKSVKLPTAVRQTLHYFALFKHAPTFGEIHTFLTVKVSRADLKSTLNHMVNERKLLSLIFNFSIYYALPPHRTFLKLRERRMLSSQSKMQKVRWMVRLLRLFPQIHLVGFSGSLALSASDKGDDIDLFVITAPGRLWTVRAICLAITVFFGLRRSRKVRQAPDKVCLNLFFDGSDLGLPPHKRTVYGAHEVLQMKPIIVRGRVYERFLSANSWVYRYFPNAHTLSLRGVPRLSGGGRSNLNVIAYFTNLLEYLLKNMQLARINRHRTTEAVTDTQLWFFPKDFEDGLPQQYKMPVSGNK